MIRVTDLSGSEWIVAREWFGLPRWSRRKASLEDGLDSLQALPDFGGFVDDLSSVVVAITLAVVLIVVFVALWILLLPLAFLLAGILAAVLALGARLLSLSAWTVFATGPEGTLRWRVRGILRSRRAMHDIASRLEHGEVPLVGATAGVSLGGGVKR